MSPPRLGLASALLTLALDQASKLYLLFGYDLPVREPLRAGPFASLIVVWNRGISYGLFQQHSEVGRWLLVGPVRRRLCRDRRVDRAGQERHPGALAGS